MMETKTSLPQSNCSKIKTLGKRSIKDQIQIGWITAKSRSVSKVIIKTHWKRVPGMVFEGHVLGGQAPHSWSAGRCA